MLKRKRDSTFDDEYCRQISSLKRAFHQWIQGNIKANPLTTWEEGCQDYITQAEQLKAKFKITGTPCSFGTGDCGQLGLGVETENDMFATRPRVIASLKDKAICAIATGGLHNLVVNGEDGTVWSWGCADNDCLGRDGDENYPSPVNFPTKPFIVQVTAGDSHSVALSVDGQVFLWGAYRDNDGKNWFPAKSGDEAFKKTSLSPVLIESVSDVSKNGGATQVSSGANQTLVLCGDGTVYSWGIGECGQLGRPVCELKDSSQVYQKDRICAEHLTPKPMQYENGTEVNNARYISTGSYHSFVIQAVRSRVYGCGLNQYSQLGFDGVKFNQFKTLKHIKSLDELGVSSIQGGEHSSLALTHDGQVYTFGRSDTGQLGVPDKRFEESGACTEIPQPVTFDPPARIMSAACGSFHCAAIGTNKTLYTWGFGEGAQLGHGIPKGSDALYPPNEPVPKPVRNKRGDTIKVVACSGSAQHTLILVETD